MRLLFLLHKNYLPYNAAFEDVEPINDTLLLLYYFIFHKNKLTIS